MSEKYGTFVVGRNGRATGGRTSMDYTIEMIRDGLMIQIRVILMSIVMIVSLITIAVNARKGRKHV